VAVYPVICHHDFSTAHAVLAQVHGRVVVPEDREAVEEAMVKEPVEKGWCTDSLRVQEEPHRTRLKEER